MLGHVRGHVGWVRNLIHRGRIVATKRVYVHSGQESENTERGTLQGVRDNVRGRRCTSHPDGLAFNIHSLFSEGGSRVVDEHEREDVRYRYMLGRT